MVCAGKGLFRYNYLPEGKGMGEWLFGPEKQFEDRAFAGSSMSPDKTTVIVHNATADGKADAGSGELFASMQALKQIEDPFAFFGFKAYAVVADLNAMEALRAVCGRHFRDPGPRCGDGNMEGVILRAKFNGIAEQV